MAELPQKRLGEASTLLGLSELGAWALDALGRWQLLADLSDIPIVKILINPWAAAVFIFIGSLLLARNREKEFEETLKAMATPVLFGIPRTLPKKPSAWKMPLTLVVLAICFAVLSITVGILLYSPPVPRAIDAYIGTRYDLLEKSPVLPAQVFRHSPPRTDNSTHQSFVENHGRMGPSSFTNSSINGASGNNSNIIKIGPYAAVGRLDMKDAHICHLSSCDGFLSCIDSDSGSTEAVEKTVHAFHAKAEDDVSKLPSEQVAVCRRELDDVENLLLNSARDEHQTVLYLRANPPACVKR
jgi:hypothetical protein